MHTRPWPCGCSTDAQLLASASQAHITCTSLILSHRPLVIPVDVKLRPQISGRERGQTLR